MKNRMLVQSLLLLTVGFLPAKLSAQTSVPPEKFVFVQPVGSAPPPTQTSSIFSTPKGVAIGVSSSPGSVSGTFFVADPNNNRVVAFPPGAGASPMNLNSLPCPICTWFNPAPPWTLSGPTYVAAAPNGNIWISDTGNDVVVEVDPTGTVVAFAGVGPNVAAQTTVCGGNCPPHPNAGQNAGQFFGPGPLAVDSAGNVYVADAAGDVFLGADSSGAFHLGCVVAGAANCPQAANFRIEEFRSDGSYVTSWGSFCSFSSTGVVIDSNGDVITGTAGGGTCDTSAPGALASGDGELAYVTGIAVNSVSNVYVADAANNRIQKFLSDGRFRLKWSGLPTGNGDGQLNAPGGIAVDGLDDSVYVVDVFNDRIQQFDGSGTFLSKGGSKGSFEAQFDEPVNIATLPTSIALGCLLAGPDDCTHGFVVAEQGRQNRVQFLAARTDQDKDGITDEVDVQPTASSNDFSNASLGFTTTGSIVDRGQQTFTIYNLLTPTPADIARLGSSACNSTGCDEIRIRTETFGGSTPLQVTFCTSTATLSLAAGMGIDVHCSTPTVFTEEGPVGFSFTGSDGTVASATLNTGNSLSVDPSTSKITSNAGTITLLVGSKSISLSPGQSTFADTTPPVVSCGSADGVWHALDVSIPCTAADRYSALANPSDANFALSTSVPAGTETANAATGTHPVCDVAGNCTTAGSITGNMIDKKPPTINVTTPISGATYSANQALSAAYTCTDLGSGVATCSGTVPNGSTIDTVPNGVSTPKTFTVNTTDKVGNAASQSIGYIVSCHYVALGISPSTVTRGSAITVSGTVESCTNTSQTVSVKFTLTGPLGPYSCANTSTTMFTTPPFSIAAGTLITKSFPFYIPKKACAGTFTVTSTTLIGGASVDSTSATLTVQ